MTTLKERLDYYNISDFKSVRDIINFKNSFDDLRNQILNHHEEIILNEKESISAELPLIQSKIEELKENTVKKLKTEIEFLNDDIKLLESTIPKHFINKIFKKVQLINLKRKLKHIENNFSNDVLQSARKLQEEYNNKYDRFTFINTNFKNAINLSATDDLIALYRKKNIINELNNYIYGAIGEQKVVKELKKLSDDYILINDFVCSYSPPIFNARDKEYIKSIQIDHILICQAGIFIIETKNWSKNSIDNINLRSPIEQIKRSNFAIYYTLNNILNLNNHHWGEKKIPIRNLIVLTNSRPKEEFKYVKILNLNELINYLKYFTPILTKIEVEKITDALISNLENCNKEHQ